MWTKLLSICLVKYNQPLTNKKLKSLFLKIKNLKHKIIKIKNITVRLTRKFFFFNI